MSGSGGTGGSGGSAGPTYPGFNFAVVERHLHSEAHSEWWLCAIFKLEAHAEAFAELLRRSEYGTKAKWEVRKV